MYILSNLIEKNQDKLECWHLLSANPNAVHLLERNQGKIKWDYLSENPSIFEIDYYYDELNQRCLIYKEELIQKAFHPSRIQKLLDMGISIEDLDDCL